MIAGLVVFIHTSLLLWQASSRWQKRQAKVLVRTDIFFCYLHSFFRLLLVVSQLTLLSHLKSWIRNLKCQHNKKIFFWDSHRDIWIWKFSNQSCLFRYIIEWNSSAHLKVTIRLLYLNFSWRYWSEKTSCLSHTFIV